MAKNSYIRQQLAHQAVFLSTSFQPHLCHFCSGEVDVTRAWGSPWERDDGPCPWFVVHHADHDHTNDDPLNLRAAAHYGCHSSYHTRRAWAEKKGPGNQLVRELANSRRLETSRARKSGWYDPEIQRANGKRGGKAAVQTNRTNGTGFFDPAIQRLGGIAAAKKINAMRFRCDECGLESTPGGVGRHQSSNTHRGRTRLVVAA